MPLDDLPPDLRATLSLLVDRGKSYTEIAELLGISESAVRDRAHAALDMLAGAPAAASSRSPLPHRRSPQPGFPGILARSPGPPVSRRGGALLLAGIAVVIVVVVLLLTSGGGSTSTHSGTSASTGTSTSPTASSGTSTGSGSKAKVTNQLTLTSPDPASKAIGIAEVLAEGSQRAIYLAAEHLAPTHGFFYVLWLYNSPTSAEAIGKTTVSSSGRVQAAALLPSNAGSYHQILLTHESSEHPSTPGPTSLSGAFSLGSP
jgi:Sigma-70, region 4